MKRTSFFSRLVRIRGQVLGLLEHRPRGLAQVHAELVGDDVRERRLAEAGRAEQQHVVHRLAAHLRRADEDLELLARLRLADVFGEPLRAQGPLDRLLVGRRGNAAHDASVQACSARRGRAGGEVVGLDAHGRLSNPRQARQAKCPDRDDRQLRSRSAARAVAIEVACRARPRRSGAVLLAATLGLKTFVPLLAAVSAQMQGKAVGDVCAVYGVAAGRRGAGPGGAGFTSSRP